ncbi:Cysteine-rich secretory protein family protein [Paenibacillus konkukensis]|uniref:Cysteine-rich secretory protein family protein n=1 Tax=Paenibacillus konkukensis TaxID=2020716 RepID=A0ABY4RNN6_9BACL|nr:CAP domain-containing protein [Paenibacillus konkukensis]UQZ82942.1 Cysteine-rich secretory protein family protein [Paenibacillus konkukensis]
MNRFQKVLLTGVLTLSPIIGVSAASAAPANTVTGNDALNALTQKYGVDLNSLLKGQQGSGIDLNSLLNGQQGNWQVFKPGSNSNGNMWAGMWKQVPAQTTNPGWGCDNGSTGNGAGTVDNGTDTSDNGTGTVDNGTDTSDNGSGTADTGTGTTNNNGSAGSDQGTANSSQSDYAAQVINLVNQERAKAGLSALTEDSSLSNMALVKAKDMYTNNYFDHNSPTYGSPFDMMKQFGISYSYAGENIAKGQRDPQEVMNSWMNSQGHRENILSPNYTKIGVAYYNGEWVQEFIAN